MSRSETVRNWMHHLHESGVRASHLTQRLVHEKSFWAILALAALITGLFVLIAFSDKGALVIPGNFNYPSPYIPHF